MSKCFGLCVECLEFLRQRRSGAVLMESRHGEGRTNKLAAEFWTFCSFSRCLAQPERRELELSNLERTKADASVSVDST